MTVFLVITTAILIIFLGVGINLLLKKNGEVPSSCASKNPLLADESGVCGACGKPAEEKCEN